MQYWGPVVGIYGLLDEHTESGGLSVGDDGDLYGRSGIRMYETGAASTLYVSTRSMARGTAHH